MSRLEQYRRQLRAAKDWQRFLERNSGLPGPRGNLELAAAFATDAGTAQIEHLLSIPSEDAPENSPGCFLVFCGVLALGRLAAAGDRSQLVRLRRWASDPRWRIREAVAMALQTVGASDIDRLLREMQTWSRGNWLEKRAAAAALAEPRLLKSHETTLTALQILDAITRSMAASSERSGTEFKVLRQGMGYCWSVVAVADLPAAKPFLRKWLRSTDPDIRWLMNENLKKNRLKRADPKWVASAAARM